MKRPPSGPTTIPALRVNQWLKIWDQYAYTAQSHRAKPLDHFFVTTMNASLLKSLSGVNRRLRNEPGVDLGIQRRHEESRSAEIALYVKYGYPYSTMAEARREREDFAHFRQPGWLPTAIVVNIVKREDRRRGVAVDKNDLITIVEVANNTALGLPKSYTGPGWQPRKRHPLEVIDGQHRLFAFDDAKLPEFEVPVVAFYGLDIGWQAYLFWTINIKPKKINASLAFDLYPLLRTQDWLEESEDYGVYRETRAQELTEKLWGFSESPWYRRINMVGDLGRIYVSQAAWIRSLMASLIKRWEGKGVSIGGLFGSKMNEDADPLPWSRIQQIAFLIDFWQRFARSVRAANTEWAGTLRDTDDSATRKFVEREGDADPAFYGPHSLINQDQGVRVLLHVLNDIFFVCNARFALDTWVIDADDDLSDDRAVLRTLGTVEKTKFVRLMRSLTRALAQYDWRSSTAPGLSEQEARDRRVYRGSGGYAELRRHCIAFLTKSNVRVIRESARQVAKSLRTVR